MSSLNYDYISMGRRLSARRRELKMTQERLAECAEITTSFIGHIERGEKKASLETIVKLGFALGISLDYLIIGKKGGCNKEECQLYKDMANVLESYS